jgi:hypothetical protein
MSAPLAGVVAFGASDSAVGMKLNLNPDMVNKNTITVRRLYE